MRWETGDRGSRRQDGEYSIVYSIQYTVYEIHEVYKVYNVYKVYKVYKVYSI